jgi:RHS repeat-associated protein
LNRGWTAPERRRARDGKKRPKPADNYEYAAGGTLLTGSGATETGMLFQGEKLEAELGDYYLRARWMIPSTGRFVSQDSHFGPESSAVSRNLYIFVHQDPGNESDPSGHDPITDISNRAVQFFGTLNAGGSTLVMADSTMAFDTATQLDSIYSETGALERLLIQEVRGPDNMKFSLSESVHCMEFMASVLKNRVNSAFDNVSSFQDAIRDSKYKIQFPGFSDYPCLDTKIQKNIDDLVADAESGKPGNAWQFLNFDIIISKAAIANRLADPGAAKGGTYYWFGDAKGTPWNTSAPFPQLDKRWIAAAAGNNFFGKGE